MKSRILLASYLFSSLLILHFNVGTLSAQTGIKFWPHWGDGKVELNSYTVNVKTPETEYMAYDFLIFGTENFEIAPQPVTKENLPKEDRLPVLKLTQLRKESSEQKKFDLERSVYSPIVVWDQDGWHYRAVSPIKTTLTLKSGQQSWNQEMRLSGGNYILNNEDSSVIDKSESRSIPTEEYMFTEEDLLIRVRELNAVFPAGEYVMLLSPLVASTINDNIEPVMVNVTRTVQDDYQKAKAGQMPSLRFMVVGKGVEISIEVENEGARRILAWERKHTVKGKVFSESAKISKSLRVAKSEVKQTPAVYLAAYTEIPDQLE